MLEMTFSEVLKARKANTHTAWFSSATAVDSANESAAARLLSGGYVKVGVTPKFAIDRNSKVFTIGSCFARNVEARLVEQGVDVVSSGFSLDPSDYVTEKINPAGALNKYNTHSIESEILAALDVVKYPDMGLLQVADDEWWDPLSTHIRPTNYANAIRIRSKIRDVTRRVTECDAVILTLGLNEVWLDRETGVYMNLMPPTSVVRRFGDRFAIVLSSFEDNVGSLERTIAAMRQASPELKVVLTVSPVPMGATLTPMDVIAANTQSKSMLRICAQVLADKHDFVDYFPSYEMVINSPRNITWYDDQIHVKDEAVRFVTSHFVDSYLTNADK